MKKVFKYAIEQHDLTTLELPTGAELLKFEDFNNQWCLWALVDSDETETEERRFRLAGTGHEITENIKAYVDSCIIQNAGLIFHLFEIE